jgi:hypothetical protein
MIQYNCFDSHRFHRHSIPLKLLVNYDVALASDIENHLRSSSYHLSLLSHSDSQGPQLSLQHKHSYSLAAGTSTRLEPEPQHSNRLQPHRPTAMFPNTALQQNTDLKQQQIWIYQNQHRVSLLQLA